LKEPQKKLASIDLNKTLIIHTIIDGNKEVKKWEKIFEINKKILNHFGYKNIYLLKTKPKIIISKKYHPFQRAELFLYQDMEILKNYKHVIYTELDAFLIKPIRELQKLCEEVDEESIMFSNYEDVMEQHYAKFMFALWSVDFYKRILEYMKQEFEIIKKIGYKKYLSYIIDIFPKSVNFGSTGDDMLFAYIMKKYKLKETVNLDCLTPQKKPQDHLQYFINCRFKHNRLIRGWDESSGLSRDFPYKKEIVFGKAFFLHIVDIDKEINSFLKYFYKELGIV